MSETKTTPPPTKKAKAGSSLKRTRSLEAVLSAIDLEKEWPEDEIPSLPKGATPTGELTSRQKRMCVARWNALRELEKIMEQLKKLSDEHEDEHAKASVADGSEAPSEKCIALQGKLMALQEEANKWKTDVVAMDRILGITLSYEYSPSGGPCGFALYKGGKFVFMPVRKQVIEPNEVIAEFASLLSKATGRVFSRREDAPDDESETSTSA